ncbi:signal peptide peptidase SppA [Candidatus Parcubacteria bacterium]|nr:signal peptide peptidase SppA [Patescibacteria group bacterium]MCG2697731.1 signal peptide peptidase SppA [Candidatus Parcubacteria bacterium]
MLTKFKQILTHPIFNFKINYSKLNPKNYNWEKVKGFLKVFILVVAAVFMVLITIDTIKSDFISDEEENEEIAWNISDAIIEYLDEYYFAPEDKQGGCNVAGIELHGNLVPYISNENYDAEGYPIVDETASEYIIAAVRGAENNDNIKAIILEIDSLGGSPVAAEEVANVLKQAKKPTVALIREYGDSAAYYAATGADIIFASANSDIGSIGVTMSYLDNIKKNQQDGLTYNQLSAGKFKDMYDPDKILTAEEKQLIMRDIEMLHENFIKAVAENRNLDIEKVRQLADGSSMLGQMALENGLIDKIGSFKEVKEYIEEIIGEEMEVCR